VVALFFDCLVEIFFGSDWRVRLFWWLFVALVAAVEFAIDVRFCGSCLREFREFRDVLGAARDVVARMREAKRARESFIINCIYLSDRLKIATNDLKACMYRK
jgi:hypothetical protein